MKQWHYLIYIGSPGVTPAPWPGYAPYAVSVSAPGYNSAVASFNTAQESRYDISLPGTINFLLQRAK